MMDIYPGTVFLQNRPAAIDCRARSLRADRRRQCKHRRESQLLLAARPRRYLITA